MACPQSPVRRDVVEIVVVKVVVYGLSTEPCKARCSRNSCGKGNSVWLVHRAL